MKYKLTFGAASHLPYRISCVLKEHNIFFIDELTGKVKSLYDKQLYCYGGIIPITAKDLLGYVEEVENPVSLNVEVKYILGKVHYQDFDPVRVFDCPIEASKAHHELDVHDDDYYYQVRLDYKAEWK